MNINTKLPDLSNKSGALSTNGRHGMCRSYYQPDEFDIKTLEYATMLSQQKGKNLFALDLGCSPYFPQSQRLAKLGFYVDAFDLENPMDGFEQINQDCHNRINYKVKDIALLASNDLTHDYQIIYSNRCLSFLTYQQAYQLIQMLVHRVKSKARFFLAFFSQSAKYASGYPNHLPLEKRYAQLDNLIARGNEMLAPVCLYSRDEIFQNLLEGCPISIVEELQTEAGSLKIIFDVLN